MKSNLSTTIIALLLAISTISDAQYDAAPCPLNFTVLRELVSATRLHNLNKRNPCQYIRQGLRLLHSDHLRRTNSFSIPPNSSESCWDQYESLIDSFVPKFKIRPSCGFETTWISPNCINITTRAQFEAQIPNPTLDDVVSNCDQSLENNSPCASCMTVLSTLQASFLPGGAAAGNVSDCSAYPLIYAGAFANRYGPSDKGTAKCLFSLDFTSPESKSKRRKILISVLLSGCSIGFLILASGYWFLRRKNERLKKKKKIWRIIETRSVPSLEESTTLVRFTIDDIKKSTRNFHRENIIGRGGYGNVYKGTLSDGSEVAFKRFKNCSAAGDEGFAHEVEVIASVRHVNLVALRGYCTATTAMEGHQRIIVCDLMKNGSVHDHIFDCSPEKTKLSWPVRRRIAIGTARGLAYLHYGAQLTIIHRDIKSSNILLDDEFEPKVADFGLAKFTPEGMTHLSTRVAGTMGYVAPEYALYGQLTDRSDVYSFGVVLLELLSGKKALVMDSDDQPSLVTDWAWSLVRKGRALDVVEDGVPELDSPEVLEKYVLVAVLCSHPQLYARPTMDQVVKMLETDLSVPSIPERQIPLVAGIKDIERSTSSTSSGNPSLPQTPRGFHSFGYRSDRELNHNVVEGKCDV